MDPIVSPTVSGNTVGGAAGPGGTGWPGKGRRSAGTGQLVCYGRQSSR